MSKVRQLERTLKHGGYHEWAPTTLARPSVCVASVVTASLLGGWGGLSTEQNVNWALGHGYRYSLFTKPLVPPSVPAVWSNPRALLRMLERGDVECTYVFYLDGDAVVNRLRDSLDALLPRIGPSVMLSCHSPFGDPNGTCHT